MQAAVARALAKRLEHRFANCQEFARAALADVPPLRLDTGSARFLCPKCRTIIRLDTSQAASAGAESRTGGAWSWEKNATKLWQAVAIWLGWLLSIGAVAVLAAGCGGAIAWVANEARGREHIDQTVDQDVDQGPSANVSQPAAIVVEEDERGLPTAR